MNQLLLISKHATLLTPCSLFAASGLRGSGWCQQKRVRGREVIRILGGERGWDQQCGHRCQYYTISINFTLSTECPEKGWCLFNKAWTLSCSYLMETLLRKINLRLASICQFLMDFRAIDGHLNKHHPFYWDTLYKLLSIYYLYLQAPGWGGHPTRRPRLRSEESPWRPRWDASPGLAAQTPTWVHTWY